MQYFLICNWWYTTDVEVPVACIILVFLFSLQHYGTHRVGILFAPVVMTWLLCISGIGFYNILHWNPHVYRALSPVYMFKFLKKTQRGGWMSLGGILLCITGMEWVHILVLAMCDQTVRKYEDEKNHILRHFLLK